MPIKSDTKRTMNFTDWVLEQQEIQDEQILDSDIDELSIQEKQAITSELLNKWGTK